MKGLNCLKKSNSLNSGNGFHIAGINEAEFCTSKCSYRDEDRNYCTYYGCDRDVAFEKCEFVHYDWQSRRLLLDFPEKQDLK